MTTPRRWGRRAVLAGWVLGLGLARPPALSAQPAPEPPVAGSTVHADPDLARFEALSRAFRRVHEQVAPAVVLIRTSGSAGPLSLPRFHPPIDPDEGPSSGLGSGVIVDAAGYVLSNHHVIRGADDIEVILQDRRRLRAEVVGVDSLIDIALLRVHADNLPVATLGTSRQLRIGDWVLAIGYPLGMGTTLTHGIVSALGRQAEVIRDRFRIESFIQTNAVINPGNSGGPLLDLSGRVVGINTAISTRTGYFMGYGLAVPIDLAREAMQDFLEYGRIVRGYLGISMSTVDAEMVRDRGLGLTPPRGVLIEAIVDDTPAALSALRAGDVLLSLDGHRVDVPNEVQTLIYSLDPGEAVTLSVWRDGAERAVTVVLGERAEDTLLARGRQRAEALGLTVAALSDSAANLLGLTGSLAGQLGLDGPAGAVVITAVEPETPSAARGLRPDDVITELDEQPVGSVEDFLRELAGLEAGADALFWLWRPATGLDVRALPIAAEPGARRRDRRGPSDR